MDALAAKLKIPDSWQQKAVQLLQAGKDVVVHAPTGAGKTYIFELLVESGLKRQAIFTVPTRALANDKLHEWRAKGWKVGICTGDITDRPEAAVVVATLETQKGKFLRGEGPGLLVIDEYQMLADARRGINYELAIALAPPGTQLLLLSGSVANPAKLVNWLRQIGRDAELVHHTERPVPQDEINLVALPDRIPPSVRGFWPQMIGRALAAGLGPILLFAPQRREAEALAARLAAALPIPDWLELTPEQRQIAGDALSKLLRQRVAYHHSGLNYLQRAGLIEPLAKAGQLRVIVATTGLAAGINFSMRSVCVTEREYRHGGRSYHVRPDELLQMFGRAGRRGLDDKGFILVAPGKPRLTEARPTHLKRANSIDWPSIIAVMREAAKANRSPIKAADELAERLFTDQRLRLGLRRLNAAPQTKKLPATQAAPQPAAAQQTTSHPTTAQPATPHRAAPPLTTPRRPAQALATPIPTPSPANSSAEDFGFRERAQTIQQMLSSAGEWERLRPRVPSPLGRAMVYLNQIWQPALGVPQTLESIKIGNLCHIYLAEGEKRYGRQVAIAAFPENPEQRHKDKLQLSRWLLAALREQHRSQSQQAQQTKTRPPRRFCTLDQLESDIIPQLPSVTQGGTPHEVFANKETIYVKLDYSQAQVMARPDSQQVPLLNPPRREARPPAFPSFAEIAGGGATRLVAQKTPAQIWHQLGLIDEQCRPTRRGVIFSFFNHGEGLAIAAALEDASYPLEDLLFDVANLRAGHRFEHFDNTGSRLGNQCRLIYQGLSCEGYLDGGVPPGYGHGAAEVLSAIRSEPGSVHQYVGEELRQGDIERASLEWRSLLNHIAFAPDYPWNRWQDFRDLVRTYVFTYFPAAQLVQLPLLTPTQKTRIQPQPADADAGLF